MALVSEDPSIPCYDIKSAELSLVALLLKSHDTATLALGLQQQLADSPGFFDQDPLLIDVSALASENQLLVDLTNLMAVLRAHNLVPMAIKGANADLLERAKGAGLVDASDARIRRSTQSVEPSVTMKTEVEEVKRVSANPGPLRIDKPLRSGQQIYAKGRDLIVIGMVNAGAEVIADGDIHVYGALRGKAIAGARGNMHAQIFAQVMEPELISIAGVYRTSENALPAEILGKAAYVCLSSDQDGDRLLISALRN